MRSAGCIASGGPIAVPFPGRNCAFRPCRSRKLTEWGDFCQSGNVDGKGPSPAGLGGSTASEARDSLLTKGEPFEHQPNHWRERRPKRSSSTLKGTCTCAGGIAHALWICWGRLGQACWDLAPISEPAVRLQLQADRAQAVKNAAKGLVVDALPVTQPSKWWSNCCCHSLLSPLELLLPLPSCTQSTAQPDRGRRGEAAEGGKGRGACRTAGGEERLLIDWNETMD